MRVHVRKRPILEPDPDPGPATAAAPGGPQLDLPSRRSRGAGLGPRPEGSRASGADLIPPRSPRGAALGPGPEGSRARGADLIPPRSPRGAALGPGPEGSRARGADLIPPRSPRGAVLGPRPEGSRASGADLIRVRILSGPDDGGYVPGFRDTVGWSRDRVRSRDRQPHLRFIEAGKDTMDALAPGLRDLVARRMRPDSAARATIAGLDAEIRAELSARPRTPAAAERSNGRLLDLAHQRHERWIETEEAMDVARSEVQPVMAQFLFRLLRRGPRNPNLAGIRVQESAWARTDPDRLRTWIRAFYRLAGTRAPPPEGLTFVVDGPRARFDVGARRVNLGHHPDAEAVFHELGHALEVADLELATAALTWRTARARHVDPRLAHHPLHTLHPSAGYGDDEMVVLDHFVTDYVGRVYDTGLAEVISVGLEHFASAQRMLQLYERDPEHFLLVLGILEADR